MQHQRYPWEDTNESVTFATPEQVEVTYRVAAFGTRILAAMIDHLLILGAVSLVFTVALLAMANSAHLTGAVGLIFLSVLASFNFVYFLWAESRSDGRTPGKKYLGLRTVMISGHGLTFSAAVLRNLARYLDYIFPFWLVPVFAKGQRRFGDFVAGTLVIDERDDTFPTPRLEGAADFSQIAERRFVLNAHAASSLYPDDLNLLDHLFTRLAGQQREYREKLCRSVARKYVERLQLEEQAAAAEEDPRAFLEELYLYLKERFELER